MIRMPDANRDTFSGVRLAETGEDSTVSWLTVCRNFAVRTFDFQH